MSEWGIGVDIGGTHISSSAVNLNTGEILKESECDLELSHEWSKELILEKWSSCINQTLSTLDVSQKLHGIGFAFPGPFNYTEGISMMDHKLVSLYKCNITTELKPLIDHGEDYVFRYINDASAFGIGECWVGMGRLDNRVILCTLGTGFGSVFMDEGQPIITRHDVPSEGCLWHLKFDQGIADEYFSTRWFVGEYQKINNKTIHGAKEIFDSIQETVSQEIVQKFTDNFTKFIGPWVQKFNADKLILGGSISKSLDLFKETLEANFHDSGITVTIQESSLKEKAAIIGAAKILDDVFWSKIKNSLGK